MLAPDDWTHLLPDTDFVRLLKSIDWSQTQAGALQQWPNFLRRELFHVLADANPACLYWGKYQIAIYNEGFSLLAGHRHPNILGKPFDDAWPELADQREQFVEDPVMRGSSSVCNRLEVFVSRNGFLEECFFTGSFTPLRNDQLEYMASYNTCYEHTSQVLYERRTNMLNLLSSPIGDYTTQTIATHIIKALETNPRDIPMAVLYQTEVESQAGEVILSATGSIGVPEDHSILIQNCNLNSSASILELCRQANDIILLPTPPCLEKVDWKGFEEPSKSIGIVQLRSGPHLFGYLLVGTNPRRPLDEHATQILNDLSRHIVSVISAVSSTEEINQRLKLLESELEQSEKQIRYLAMHAEIGMQHVRMDGAQVWANDHWFKITGIDKDDAEICKAMGFMKPIHPDSSPDALDVWRQFVMGEVTELTIEIKLKQLWTPPVGDPEPIMTMAVAFRYQDAKNTLIMACMVDISHLKWQENWQKRSAEEAREAKRQQEQFIDAISHEVRNPLSAIFQLADLISGSLQEVETRGRNLEVALQQLSENASAAKTILACAEHQKRIVDDVLTMSKLDFEMLSIISGPVQPRKLIDAALTMFEADFLSNGIEMSVKEDLSIQESPLQWVSCDGSRVTQIFINLLSNAIKFTKPERIRRVDISWGISEANPAAYLPQDIYWGPQDKIKSNEAPDWSEDKVVYLMFQVRDTGAGMAMEEKARLFHRFAQGTNRTFIKYGGSGLGLFISSQLATKQGGNIGVMSAKGEGSTFIFYIKAKRHIIVPKPLTTSSSLQDLRQKSPNPADNDTSHRSINVLLVEDNLVNQQILVKQLHKAGCTVTVANHGGEALEKLRIFDCWSQADESTAQLPLDFILMDWEMPVMGGIECTQQIRKQEQEGLITRHIQIIGVTANSRPEQIRIATAAGMDSVLPKPFIVKDLISLMRSNLVKSGDETS